MKVVPPLRLHSNVGVVEGIFSGSIDYSDIILVTLRYEEHVSYSPIKAFSTTMISLQLFLDIKKICTVLCTEDTLSFTHTRAKESGNICSGTIGLSGARFTKGLKSNT